MGNTGNNNRKFGQKQWEIRGNAMGNSGKSNVCRRFPSFSLLLPKFSHCFARISHSLCPDLPLLLPEFAIAFPEIRAKAMGKFGKSNEKTRKATGYRHISGKNYGSFGQFLELTYYFQNFLPRSGPRFIKSCDSSQAAINRQFHSKCVQVAINRSLRFIATLYETGPRFKF